MIELKEVTLKGKEILERLMQLYLHNISLDFPMEFNSKNGMYQYDDLDKYFSDEEHKALFILSENEICGFTLIDLLNDKNIVQEMFVLNHCKRKGIGKQAINIIFDKYKGEWEIKSLPCSENASNFWISTVKEYTDDNFELEYVGKYNRAVLTFRNR